MDDCIDVAVPLGVRKTFAYSVPQSLAGVIRPGMRVVVPFGRKLVSGYVIGPTRQLPGKDIRIRAIRSVLDPEPLLPADLVQTAMWIAEYYFTPPGTVFAALFPPGTKISGTESLSLTPAGKRLLETEARSDQLDAMERQLLQAVEQAGTAVPKRLAQQVGRDGFRRLVDRLIGRGLLQHQETLQRPRVQARTQLGIMALDQLPESAARLTAAQQRLASILEPGALMPLHEAMQRAGCSRGVAASLARKGLARIGTIRVDRSPEELSDSPPHRELVLTDAQRRVFERLLGLLDSSRPQRCLLHGVTGSGKTEIYLRLIAEVIRRGGQAMLLVPEIGLTPLLSRQVVSYLPGRVAILHSGMASGERFDQWHRIRSGHAPVVLGTRSAVFAPLDKLRLVIMDEEQDASYKQEEPPVYHAREVAWQRLQCSRGMLLIGSATPSVETFHAAANGEIEHLQLPERIEARPLPEVEVLDMSQEFQRHGRNQVLSQELQAQLEDSLARGEQAIILLNRRGYSRSMLCRSCGHVLHCPDCSVALTYHQEERKLICHYCGTQRGIPQRCERCEGSYIYFVGVGTEQLEEILRARFPHARIARVDRDSTRRRGTMRRILMEFSAGRLDILVGTQMLAKGHDFPNVTLVGVIAADVGLSFPDFRAGERTFQLLTQVAGRAGRGRVPGRVVIQSYYPGHYALTFAKRQDFAGFYAKEIEFRSMLGYPPFNELVQLIVTGVESTKVATLAGRVAAELRQTCRLPAFRPGVRILGPAPAPLEKIRGEYRYQILIKYAKNVDKSGLLRQAFERLAAKRASLKNVRVEVDPLSLL